MNIIGDILDEFFFAPGRRAHEQAMTEAEIERRRLEMEAQARSQQGKITMYVVLGGLVIAGILVYSKVKRR